MSSPSRKRAVLALAAAGWLAACSAAWRGSTASGGDVSHAAEAVGSAVADATRLRPLCRDLATRLVEAGMRVRIAAGRPTVPMLRSREADALADWELARCPDRALPVIAYGVIDGVRGMREAQFAGHGG